MVFFVNSSTCCELGISIERVVSIKKPAEYHVSPLACVWILLFIAVMCGFSGCVGWLITHRVETTQAMTGALLNNVNDMVAFVTSMFVLVHCRNTYNRLKMNSNRTLNERYQTKEAYSVARAMLPAYICNMTCKMLCMCCNWVYITGFHRLHGGYGIFEAIYILLNIIVCGVGSSFFLMGHDQLRVRVWKLTGRSGSAPVVPFKAPTETLVILSAVVFCAFANYKSDTSPAPLSNTQKAEIKAKVQEMLAKLSPDAQAAGNKIIAAFEANEGNMEATKAAVESIMSSLSDSVKAEVASILPGGRHFVSQHKAT
ncbi:hypothetical protein PFISCL1PPCAC_25368, partial [Pristionchus fissidentatus]